jgi:hypothetical protein
MTKQLIENIRENEAPPWRQYSVVKVVKTNMFLKN